MLVENKIDMIEDQEEKLDIEQNLKIIANSNNFCGSFLTSAKEDVGVNDTMRFLLETIVDKMEKCEESGQEAFDRRSRNESVMLERESGKKEGKKEKKGCCKK